MATDRQSLEPGHNDDAFHAAVSALGTALGWCAAGLWRSHGGEDRPLLVREWVAEDNCGCRGEALHSLTSVLPEITREGDGLVRLSTPAADDADAHAAVLVPCWAGDSVTAVLGFSGRSLKGPADAEDALLRALAAMLEVRSVSTGTPATSTAPAPVGESMTRAISLVDVFAFTVELLPDGGSHWLYFGPNSHVVFGAAVSAEETLTALLARHVHPDDRAALEEFQEATAAARPAEVEVRIAGLDGATRWVSWRGVPRQQDGRLIVDGVATDVTARRNLTATHQNLRDVEEQRSHRADMNRKHDLIVRDANDNVLQRIFAAGLRLQVLQRRLSEVDAHAAAAISFQLEQAANDLREIIFGLNLKVQDHGLTESLQKCVDRAAHLLGFDPFLAVRGDTDSLDPVVVNEAVSVVEQALSNVVRHAAATAVTVDVEVEDGTFSVKVVDNGRGLSADVPHTRGLDGIRRRATALGGVAEWHPSPTGGVALTWQVPVVPPADAGTARL